MENIHDRAISQTENQLQAVAVSVAVAHADFQLASNPAAKVAGAFVNGASR